MIAAYTLFFATLRTETILRIVATTSLVMLERPAELCVEKGLRQMEAMLVRCVALCGSETFALFLPSAKEAAMAANRVLQHLIEMTPFFRWWRKVINYQFGVHERTCSGMKLQLEIHLLLHECYPQCHSFHVRH